MNDAIESISAAFAVAIVFGIPFGFFAFVRYLRYKETVALAQQGLLRPARARRNRDTLKWGIVIMMMGLGLTCGVLPVGFLDGDDFLLGPWILVGVLPFFFGLSLIMVYYVNKSEDREDGHLEEPDPIPSHKQADFSDE